MADIRIPFNRPALFGNELAYVQEAVASGHLSGDGQFTDKCNALLQELTGAHRCLLTTSCTHALEMCALLLEIGPEDEVVVPAFTFVSTANAFALRGAKIVFADIRSDTLNLDEAHMIDLMTPKTKAVVVVHYAGVGCEMEAITKICADAGVALIEDNAHGLFGTYRGKPLGSFGQLATQSFHETKNVTCGEGGALLINDPALVARAEILREKGTNRSAFFRGAIDKYTWVDLGSSYLPSELNAAFLWGQLEKRSAIQERRQELWLRYDRGLASWADACGVVRPTVPDYCEHPAHMYYLLFPTSGDRDTCIGHLGEAGILATFHYQPLQDSAMGRAVGVPAQCPVTQDVSQRLMRLPLFAGMTDDEFDHVAYTLKQFRSGHDA